MKYEEIGTWEEMSMDVCATLTKGECVIGLKFSVCPFDQSKDSIITKGVIELEPNKLYWIVVDNKDTATIYIAHDAWNAANFWHKFESGEMKPFEVTVVCPTDKQLSEIDAHYTMQTYKPMLDKWLLQTRKKERFRREARAKEAKKI